MNVSCTYCGATGKLTRDHIIPEWIYKRAHYVFPKFRKNLGVKNYQSLCNSCNNKKSGYIDMRNPIAREFWLAVKAEIENAEDRADLFLNEPNEMIY